MHASAKAHLTVVPNPFFALTGADGRFVLPPGNYTLRVFHPDFGRLEKPFVISLGDDVVSVAVGFPEEATSK